MGRYFGTDGFRGEVNVVLTAEHAYKIGRFLGWYFSELKKLSNNHDKAKIVIGKDARKSGYLLEDALCAGISSSGANTYLMHVTPTPSVAYITKTDNFDCGIMISASHNPFYDNGIKLLNSNGEKMDDEVISLIEDYLDDKLFVFNQEYKTIPYAARDQVGYTIDYSEGREKYVRYLISLGKFFFRGKKIAVDCANGASYKVAHEVFSAMGGDICFINDTPTGININDHAGSTHMEALQDYVKENHCDCGFAFDGDADRCLAVDENGNLVNGDQIIYLYAAYLKQKNKLTNDEVVATVMSNIGLFKALDKLNIKHHATPVGDKNVHDYMVSHGSLIGGEQSGHIIFSKYASTGDGILTALKIMEVIMDTGSSLSELVKDCFMYPQTLINVKVKSKTETMEDKDVLKSADEVSSLLGDSGRILVRGSGTEPLVRVMVEAPTKDICDEMCNKVVKVIEKKGYKIN